MRAIHRVITMSEENSTSTGDQAGAAQEQQQQTTETPKKKTFTQDQLNAALKAEKKEWQARMKELEAKASQWDKLQEDSKSEMEKLTGEVGKHKTEAEQARLEAAKLRALMKAGAPADKVDALLKRVVGSTPEEIEADVAELAGLGLLAAKTPTAAQGAGNNGVPGSPGKKTWKRSEIQALLQDPTKTDPKTLDEINLAQREGRVDYNS